jgi:hypothetical protein
MNVIVSVRNKPTPVTIQTFDRTIDVQVSPVSLFLPWVHDNWYWILPGLPALAGFMGWVIKKIRDGKKQGAGFVASRK